MYERLKETKADFRKARSFATRELKLLALMLKQDVNYHHHGRVDSMKTTIAKHIEEIKNIQKHNREQSKLIEETYGNVYPRTVMLSDSYVWNYQESNFMHRAQLGNLFSRTNEFDTIHDVPTDGTYKFEIYDSGQRGLGSFNYIKAVKVETEFETPYVNPGAMIPVTAN